MQRRSFLQTLPAGITGIMLIPEVAWSTNSESKIFRSTRLEIISANNHKIPEGKRAAFNWPAFGIAPGESIILKPEQKLGAENLWLRVSVAQEIRDEKSLLVSIPEVNIQLGKIDILFSSVLVPYELEIDGKYAEQISKHGLELKLESPSPLWIYSNEAKGNDNSAFLPNIISSSEKTGTTDQFLNCFTSVNSVQAFGWREGTVLDGLWQLYSLKGNKKALAAVNQHLDLFFDGQDLVYEDGRSNPKQNEVDGIESTIPFATLARINPSHPILKTVVEGWQRLKKPNGMIIDGTMVSAEGCYTVAYPMAVIGKLWNDKNLMNEAMAQLKHRFVLFNDNSLYLRYYTEGRYTYRNWSRGAAWTLLGFARTLSELKDIIQNAELIDKFKEGIDRAISMQREDGLWSCFMHRHEILPDTGGSAGIAAAILAGIKLGLVPDSYRVHAEKCWDELQNYISPDGFLRGVAQDNRAGEKLQESDYRVIAQMGMGLMAQLYAEL